MSLSEQHEVTDKMEPAERRKVSPIKIVKGDLGYKVVTSSTKPRCKAYCCCAGHCSFVFHGKAGSVPQLEEVTNFSSEVLGNVDEVDSLLYEDCLDSVDYTDSFTDLIQYLNVDFSLS